ncbi:MAG: NAD(P)-dependent oxidoreductase, partial [Candidatus Tectomicrobia bacterium]
MAQRPLVVVPSDDPPQCQGSPRMQALEAVADVRIFTDRCVNFEAQIERSRGAVAIINSRGYIKWQEEAFALLPDLKFITVCGIGTDSVDLEAARKYGVIVSNIPGKTAPVVAEHAFDLMFAAAKRAAWYTAALKGGQWVKEDAVYLRGKTVGIIGTGNIGAEMARLCQALGMKVLAWTFHPSEERARALGVTYVSLDELFQRADVVSLHPKLTSETKGLIGKRETFLVLGEDGAWHQADLYRVTTPTGPYSPAPNYLDL